MRLIIKLPAFQLRAEVFATLISGIALTAAVTSAWSSYNALGVSRQTQMASIFLQFQEGYNEVAARFPERLRDPTFTPARNTDDYRRLEEYWIFCFAEWFATHDLEKGAYDNLWRRYYAALAQGALNIPSLRYVLIDMKQRQNAYPGAFPDFFEEIGRIAANAGIPLPNDPKRTTPPAQH